MSKKNSKTTGIILGSRRIKETDKTVYIFSKEQGKIRTLAKGALKPTSKFTGNIETLNTCELELYQGPGNLIITELKLLSSPKNIRDNYQKTEYGLLIAKLTDIMTLPNTTSQDIFNLLSQAIKNLEETNKPLLTLAHYIINLLNILGLLPDFKNLNQKNFHTPVKEKFKKLLQYLRNSTLQEVERIALTTEETEDLKNILKDLVHYEIDKNVMIP